MSTYPLLRDLLGTHLHQDWEVVDPDPTEALLVGVREDYLTELPVLLDELRRLRTELDHVSPDRGQQLLRTLGSQYRVAGSGITPSAWVARLIDEIRSLADGGPADQSPPHR